MPRSLKPPAYLLHKVCSQARVTINGMDHYLGPHGSPESKDRYDDLIHKWQLQAEDNIQVNFHAMFRSSINSSS